MSRIYDCADETARKDGIVDAASAVRKGELVVLPTDTVYGIGTDAFSPKAVADLLAAKGRGREMPPPVLVGSMRAATALIDDLGTHGRDLMEEFWPGPLTLVCTATPSLSWDLGDTKGTVAVRMPMDPVALELLKEVGPMAVSSANKSGQPAAATMEEALEQLGDEVAVYLDGGESEAPVASTIVDLTYAVPRVLRAGAISIEQLRGVCGTVIGELRKGRTKPKPAESEEPGDAAAESAGATEPADGTELAAKAEEPGTPAPTVGETASAESAAEADARADAGRDEDTAAPNGERSDN
ncbi:tRNA threonylcarbamoyl adenosine modification protein (Sua5/YciO/YrdC/YwlC family) [Nocardiopsis sp. Huas11]|uniref:L-threonylcarbamoyladenylate synthase n=1 Tax=Nocardiopsis sp. Huas11 TaxID=2183912 RepID=UPI000EABB403|nr:L-threonylcarbamoyladenylate synthase [Nocardiopsis sp. Huas11]RKS10571.1 tRNA threonylcarbamoyl adenosine modification protein (Sua5/YciO/YrdC/YwlC family) [Nocardiopsis sp. Huas11]